MGDLQNTIISANLTNIPIKYNIIMIDSYASYTGNSV